MNQRDNEGSTALYLCCAKPLLNSVSWLLAHGADPNLGSARRYPLHLALTARAAEERQRCVQLLLASGARAGERRAAAPPRSPALTYGTQCVADVADAHGKQPAQVAKELGADSSLLSMLDAPSAAR